MTPSRRLSVILAGLIAGFVALSVPELVVALQAGAFKAALFVDGLHNALEIVSLGLNLRECRRKGHGVGESSIPKWTVGLTLMVALPSAGYALANSQHAREAGVSVVLAALSLTLNIVGGWLVHNCGVQNDHNAESVLVHLASDIVTAGAALVVYGFIALGASAEIDPIATIVGAVIVAIVNIWYLHRHTGGHAHMHPSP